MEAFPSGSECRNIQEGTSQTKVVWKLQSPEWFPFQYSSFQDDFAQVPAFHNKHERMIKKTTISLTTVVVSSRL